jgi:hypothetical protein
MTALVDLESGGLQSNGIISAPGEVDKNGWIEIAEEEANCRWISRLSALLFLCRL